MARIPHISEDQEEDSRQGLKPSYSPVTEQGIFRKVPWLHLQLETNVKTQKTVEAPVTLKPQLLLIAAALRGCIQHLWCLNQGRCGTTRPVPIKNVRGPRLGNGASHSELDLLTSINLVKKNSFPVWLSNRQQKRGRREPTCRNWESLVLTWCGPGTNHLQVWKCNVWIFPDEVHCEERGIGGKSGGYRSWPSLVWLWCSLERHPMTRLD